MIRFTASHDPTAQGGSAISSRREPCSKCLFSIHWSTIDRLVFRATRHEAAAIWFDDNLRYDERQCDRVNY